jgi:HSP20 family protein
LRLPFPVDPEQVQAHFENGVLTVTLPKTAQQERSRRIQVQGRGSTAQGATGGSRGQETTGTSNQSDDTRSG